MSTPSPGRHVLAPPTAPHFAAVHDQDQDRPSRVRTCAGSSMASGTAPPDPPPRPGGPPHLWARSWRLLVDRPVAAGPPGGGGR